MMSLYNIYTHTRLVWLSDWFHFGRKELQSLFNANIMTNTIHTYTHMHIWYLLLLFFLYDFGKSVPFQKWRDKKEWENKTYLHKSFAQPKVRNQCEDEFKCAKRVWKRASWGNFCENSINIKATTIQTDRLTDCVCVCVRAHAFVYMKAGNAIELLRKKLYEKTGEMKMRMRMKEKEKKMNGSFSRVT